MPSGVQQARRPAPREVPPGSASDPVRAAGVSRRGLVAVPAPARPQERVARLRSALGVALLPCAFAATLVWLVFLVWLVVVLVDLPFR